MTSYAGYFDDAVEFFNDINIIFDSPVLRVAIEKLTDYIKKQEAGYWIFSNAAYTIDDAFRLSAHKHVGGLN